MLKFLLCGLSLCFVVANTAIAKQTPDNEAILKAALIYKFSQFIEWPTEKKRTPLVLCTLGKDELVNVFEMTYKDKIQSQLMQVQSIQDNHKINHCHILYIAKSERGSYRSLDAVTQSEATLTISELAGFTQSGGMIEFGYENKRVHFVINLDAAHLVGIQISSRLLELARDVIWDNKP